MHILPDYFPDVADTRRRETGGFEVVVEEDMAAEGKGAQTAKKRWVFFWRSFTVNVEQFSSLRT